jgi:hypothetical protein
MEFDEMLATWRTQATASPYDVNRDVLRQALEVEEARARRSLRVRRGVVWFYWILGTGMAIWAGFWIAITITNGWPAIYAVAAGACVCLFASAVGAFWMGRGPKAELEQHFGNTLQEEVRRSLALVDYQLSLTRHWIFFMLGSVFTVLGVWLFTWTLNSSQNIPQSSFGGWSLFSLVFVFLALRALYRSRHAMRKARPKLETRQRHLRELLAALDARE